MTPNKKQQVIKELEDWRNEYNSRPVDTRGGFADAAIDALFMEFFSKFRSIIERYPEYTLGYKDQVNELIQSYNKKNQKFDLLNKNTVLNKIRGLVNALISDLKNDDTEQITTQNGSFVMTKNNIRIHPKIWTLIIKMYGHYYRDIFKDVLLALNINQEAKNTVKDLKQANLNNFFSSLPLEDQLIVIKDILQNQDVKNDINNNWNYYGDYIKLWRGQLIDYLKENGIEYNEDSKTFYQIGSGSTPIISAGRKFSVLLDDSIVFKDYFYDALKNEINKAYASELFTSTIVLGRKLIENLLIEILRLKYPPNGKGNLELYFNTSEKRFHDFTILLKNLEDKKTEFSLDEQIIFEFISLVKPFRPTANATAHSIIIVSVQNDILRYNIPKMVALLLKLKSNLLNNV